jgi:hypothetical protein
MKIEKKVFGILVLGFKGTVSPVYNWLKVVSLDRPWLTHQALAI